MKSVGILEARDAGGRLWPHTAIELTPQPFQRPLQCGGCESTVHPRHGYSRSSKHGRVSEVRAHFYLANDTVHAAGCRFDYDRRARDLAAECAGTVVDDGSGRWRLILPPDAAPAPERPQRGAHVRSARTAWEITANETTLMPALNSAAKIARLLADFINNPAAAERFRARLGERTLEWEEFCYGPGDYQHLAARLAPGPAAHPLAVHGVTFVSKAGSNGHGLYARGRARLDQSWVPIVVRAANEALLAPAIDRPWLAYGMWKLWIAGSGYRELQLWIKRPWQITTWDLET